MSRDMDFARVACLLQVDGNGNGRSVRGVTIRPWSGL